MLSVSLDCPFLIAPSVFSYAYLVLTTLHLVLKDEDEQRYWSESNWDTLGSSVG